jgi:hypothetical protein
MKISSVQEEPTRLTEAKECSVASSRPTEKDTRSGNVLALDNYLLWRPEIV